MKHSLASDYAISYLALLSGLSISAVAVYYSVIGLVSIFSASAGPIMIMGVALEVSKLIATVWLKRHWSNAPKIMIAYLTTAVFVLMLITSMGIFGYLSKAHLDQAVPSGAIIDKVALFDEKIKTQKDTIELSRKAIAQLDSAVDQTMSRSTSEKGANKAVQIRKLQAKERSELQHDIATAQKETAILNDQRAPVAAELRKVEAEVGPIKYIAALIYGDSLDSNVLERAVRWMIILIVSVFDPMAIMLLLACQHSFREISKKQRVEELFAGIQENENFTYEKAYEEFVLPAQKVEADQKLDEAVKEAIVNSVAHGKQFPDEPEQGQQFTRTDYTPSRDFIFNGSQWVSAEQYLQPK